MRSTSQWRPGTSFQLGGTWTPAVPSSRRESPRGATGKLGPLGTRRFVEDGGKITYDKETFLKFYNLKKERCAEMQGDRSEGKSVFVSHFDDSESKWCPSSREGGTLTQVDGRAYLVGGMSNDMISHIAIFSCSTAENNRWEMVQLS